MWVYRELVLFVCSIEIRELHGSVCVYVRRLLDLSRLLLFFNSFSYLRWLIAPLTQNFKLMVQLFNFARNRTLFLES